MVDVTRDRDGKPLLDPARVQSVQESFVRLVCLMEHLRASCPWDRKQTADSLKRYVQEEAYEVIEAIENKDWPALADELGDHVLQVVFLAKIMQEEGHFQVEDVLDQLVEKMVRRHPHVFGDVRADDADQVLVNWETIKQQERGQQSGPKSLFDGRTMGLPALLESYKIGKKAGTTGFDWPEPDTVLDKIEEEIGEIRQARAQGDAGLQEELGDLLFAVSNLVRKYGFEPEETLRLANRKFVRRFQTMERLADERGVDFASLDLDTQEGYWQEAKSTGP